MFPSLRKIDSRQAHIHCGSPCSSISDGALRSPLNFRRPLNCTSSTSRSCSRAYSFLARATAYRERHAHRFDHTPSKGSFGLERSLPSRRWCSLKVDAPSKAAPADEIRLTVITRASALIGPPGHDPFAKASALRSSGRLPCSRSRRGVTPLPIHCLINAPFDLLIHRLRWAGNARLRRLIPSGAQPSDALRPRRSPQRHDRRCVADPISVTRPEDSFRPGFLRSLAQQRPTERRRSSIANASRIRGYDQHTCQARLDLQICRYCYFCKMRQWQAEAEKDADLKKRSRDACVASGASLSAFIPSRSGAVLRRSFVRWKRGFQQVWQTVFGEGLKEENSAARCPSSKKEGVGDEFCYYCRNWLKASPRVSSSAGCTG